MKNVPGGHNLFVSDKETASVIENLYSVSVGFSRNCEIFSVQPLCYVFRHRNSNWWWRDVTNIRKKRCSTNWPTSIDIWNDVAPNTWPATRSVALTANSCLVYSTFEWRERFLLNSKYRMSCGVCGDTCITCISWKHSFNRVRPTRTSSITTSTICRKWGPNWKSEKNSKLLRSARTCRTPFSSNEIECVFNFAFLTNFLKCSLSTCSLFSLVFRKSAWNLFFYGALNFWCEICFQSF